MERTSLVILTPFLDDYDVIVYQGDCIKVMAQMPEASVDAIVTDPPYGIGFMGKEWDVMKGDPRSWADMGGPTGKRHTGGDGSSDAGGAMKAGLYDLTPVGMNRFQVWTEAWAREAFRILKPGGHLLAFAGTRTYHRMASGVEDAGFEIRDCIAWMYGSGFPKSKNVALAIDKGEGYPNRGRAIPTASSYQATDKDKANKLESNPVGEYNPNTPEAAKWNGWGTALKPAYEPIVVARKPLIGTVAANVLEHGTGALNIDACRIGVTDEAYAQNFSGTRGHDQNRTRAAEYGITAGTTPASGRWPANVALDETAAAILDAQSGWQKDGTAVQRNLPDTGSQLGSVPVKPPTQRADDVTYGGGGGASRFFYTAKASRHDRNAGGLADNTHPTVKPTELMRWLIRLVTPPDGIILDPFGGSGSTGLAARAENVRCILIEREPEYLNIIRDRLAQLSLFAIPDEDAA
jgi:site-specific DNA-methyltransferase (adenine-specific)